MTGIIPLKKGMDITSFFAVNKLRRITEEKKAGHTGTLDPNATGVLPVALGGATRFIELLPTHVKEYEAQLRLGIETDTLDIWGQVTKTCDKDVEPQQVIDLTEQFTGEIMQLPPMYSAIRKDGVRLYELARQGKEVERTPRKCTIYELKIQHIEGRDYKLTCRCSAGTYIRTLISDIGDAVGTGAVMTALSRTYACGVSIDDCYTLEELQIMKDEDRLSEALIPIDRLLECYPPLYVTDNQAVRFSNGGDLMAQRVKGLKDHGLYRVYGKEKFLGLGEYAEGSDSLAVKRVYNER
ncbi:MAG: tRNA pseudouridine(55) synthase TruB [Clostridia bacterium]|nr:tRNA pseudouridine(55) synthase TruB [Clostridia bacterium]